MNKTVAGLTRMEWGRLAFASILVFLQWGILAILFIYITGAILSLARLHWNERRAAPPPPHGQDQGRS